MGALLQTVILRWEWTKRRFGTSIHDVTSNGYVWVATLIAFLLFITFSPYIEEKRWPFSAWFAGPSSEEFNSLRTRLSDAKGQRDQAIAERNSAQGGWAADRKAMEALQSQLQIARNELDIARQAAKIPPPAPAPEDQIPINWQPDFRTTWVDGPKMIRIHFEGKATTLARVKGAYIISNLTGHREELDVVNAANPSEKWSVDQIEPVTSGAVIILVHEWAPPVSVPEFLVQWGTFEMHVVYDNKEYVKSYSQEYTRDKMAHEVPGVIGPRVTRKPSP